jgi:hypothetical protein
MLILLFIVILIVALFILNYKKQREEIKLFQFNGKFDNYDNSDIINKPFSELGLKSVKTFKEGNFLLFSDYTFMDMNIKKIPFRKDQIIYGFNGMDQLANKAYLARHMKNTKYIPRTYILSEKEFPTEQAIYFLKKNVQRQEGTLITNDLNYIREKASDDNYVIAQELLQDVFLVNKRKINMRVYLMLLIIRNKIYWFIYNDGFMYYTPKFFEPNSLDKDVNITTGYIDRQVYEENPLTHKDFYAYIGKQKADLLQRNIIDLFKTVKDIYSQELLELNRDIPGMKVNIMGADVGPTSSLQVTLIETNKGCSLTYMDERDKKVKYNMIRNMFGLLGLIPKTDSDKWISI